MRATVVTVTDKLSRPISFLFRYFILVSAWRVHSACGPRASVRSAGSPRAVGQLLRAGVWSACKRAVRGQSAGSRGASACRRAVRVQACGPRAVSASACSHSPPSRAVRKQSFFSFFHSDPEHYLTPPFLSFSSPLSFPAQLCLRNHLIPSILSGVGGWALEVEGERQRGCLHRQKKLWRSFPRRV